MQLQKRKGTMSLWSSTTASKGEDNYKLINKTKFAAQKRTHGTHRPTSSDEDEIRKIKGKNPPENPIPLPKTKPGICWNNQNP